MKRVRISVSDEFAKELVAFASLNGYDNRSETFRDLMRLGLEKARSEAGGDSGYCVTTLSYVSDLRVRGLPTRQSEAYQAYHDLLVANMRVHLNKQLCLDVVVLRGSVPDVREFAQKIIAERGVTHGSVNFAPSGWADGRLANRASRSRRTPSLAKAEQGE